MMDRRKFIVAGMVLGASAVGAVPGIAWAKAETAKRFVFIIQRGAADGLALLAPTGDPDYLRARGDLASGALDGTALDDIFTLHNELPKMAGLFAQKQAAFTHAVASGYRERSHFDAQNILESGALRPYGRSDGWMNRLLTLLPEAHSRALAVAPSVPLALRGVAPATSYERSRLRGAEDALMQRISMLYAEDEQLSGLWDDALQSENMAEMAAGMTDGPMRGGAATGATAAGLMTGAAGAKIVMLETGGWDTHSNQQGRLGSQLKQLDALIDSLRAGLGNDWTNTLVLVATEFGRTVAFNGTRGTDHGTASAIIQFGGALENGGKVTADWPGLKPGNLHEGRDLKPTLRFENVVSDALSHHYAMDPAQLKQTLFPDYI